MSHKILIVDDNDDMREVMRLCLKIEGFTVIVGSDGIEGIKAVMNENPDLVVTDASMPNLNGVEMTKQLRADLRFTGLPIIILTGLGSALRLEAKAAGADDVLMKPADPALLVSKINVLLGL